ncbi:MAG: hypothetical protein HY067_07865 [Betaproteobacteria bacterium]|nr:hypothetical protein [Betaproteobacteria bacterium]
MNKHEILRSMTFGQRVAEEETDVLATYFVETDHWQRLYGGEIDVVYGPKGSGKSALYSLLLSKNTELFDRNIVLVAGENPRGATAFRDLATDPPASEREFVGLWKLYIAALLHSGLAEYGIRNDFTNQLEVTLAREGLVKGSLSLSGLLRAVVDYARRALRPQAIEGDLELDPITQLPKGFKGKIIFSEPGRQESDPELRSVDRLLELANNALAKSNFQSWILLDRLDVAFAEESNLENNALRALFRVYLDLLALSNVKLKIFLRTDIWTRITSAQGFREASHITRHVTISWNRGSLLNLVLRRALHNASIRDAYGISQDLPRQSVDAQEKFFYRMCPEQVDVGPNKSNTFDWLLTRTRDGTKENAPRELVHFLNSLREVQVKRFEIGQDEPEGEQLFARPSFKDALPEVSKVRLEQTLYAEYPGQKDWIEKLRTAKTLQTPETLAGIWGISSEEASQQASELANIGFFEARGTRQSPEYWVPFIYRDALDLVQGAAE